MPSFLKYAIPRVTSFLKPQSKQLHLPDPTLASSSCLIIPTSLHLSTPLRYHFIVPKHVLQPFDNEKHIVHTDAQFQFFESLKSNSKINVEKDLRCNVEILPRNSWNELIGARGGMDEDELAELAFAARRVYWDQERHKNDHQRKLYEALKKEMNPEDRQKIAGTIVQQLLLADFDHVKTQSIELDLKNAFIHDRFNFAVAHAKQEPTPESLPNSLLINEWCDRELDIGDRVYYAGWQMEDVGSTSEQSISPRQWKGRISQLTSSRVSTEPDAPNSEGKFHYGMVGGPVFADRGCIGMIEGTVSSKQTTSEKLGYEKPRVTGVMHASHHLLEKFITDTVEPQMEQRYQNYDPYAEDKKRFMETFGKYNTDW